MIAASGINNGQRRKLTAGARRMIANDATYATQRKRYGVALPESEEQVHQLQRSVGVEQLAGGIAHHFNNILTVVIGYGTLLQMKINPDDPLRKYIEYILSSSELAADLTKKLLAFSGQQRISPRIAELNETVRNTQRLFSLFINNGIKLQMKLSDRNLPVIIDVACFEEAMVDLISNAVDAMPQGGTLTIATEYPNLRIGYTDRSGDGGSAPCALLTVVDTGIGMARKVKKRIFYPLFTTKEVGKGTGLGLSVVYGIVRQHNGRIDVESQPGKGTKVSIYLLLAKLEMSDMRLILPHASDNRTNAH